MIQTTKYIRKPLLVDVVQVTDDNFEAVADWCQGEIKPQGDGDHGRYIFVRVHSPRNPRQTKAYVGDWILYTERGYKVYTTKAFLASFEPVEEPEAYERCPAAPAASSDERLREAGERLAQAVAQVCGEGHPALGMWRVALAAADREAASPTPTDQVGL